MNTDLLLNIAITGGLLPLLLGLFVSIIPEIKFKMIDARQAVTIFVICSSLVFNITVLAIYNSFADIVSLTVFSGCITLLWLRQLGYLNRNKKATSRSLMGYENERVSLFHLLFGYESTPRLVTVAGFFVIGVFVFSLASAPTWLFAMFPAMIYGFMWAAEDVKIFNR